MSVTKNRNRFLQSHEVFPIASVTILAVIIIGCIICEIFIPYDPTRMMLDQISQPPSGAHIFGTDTLGRDLFSVVWHGGRISITVGLLATLISTVIAVIYGTAAGLAGKKVDDLLMRFTEILLSIPQILMVIFIQAIWGDATVLSISVVIGITGWMAVAKMVRSEVKQLRNAGFVLVARTMGAGFFYILRKHLMPNFMSAIMFMIVTNIGSAIAMEATLSFMGLGLPTDIISWGSLMSLSQRAMLTGAWWMLLIPGVFLVVTLICITDIGEYMRNRNRKDRLM
ncbi:MAG: ABC transporter permease [Firmicutes bacterium]|nr:ABC transporter permease [Bacillota bacterium]MBR3788120.1 ABC transporter permease [Bacillota bacterium]